MTNDSKANVMGLIAIVVGALLIMGGVSFLSTTLIMNEVPRALQIPPLVQVALGATAIFGGFFMRRGSRASKYLLGFVVVGVVTNVVFLVSIMVMAAR